MESELKRAYDNLAAWCRKHNYAGYDPFDALNSRLFQAMPLKHSRAARIIWTQLFKRSPVNLRKIACVPAARNAKGMALFALAALADFRRTRTKEAETEARTLLDALLSARLEGWSGAAWGYNFHWQSRAFFAPQGTPTIVPTAFAARALVEAAQVFNDEKLVKHARSVCDFILRDLQRRSEEHTSELQSRLHLVCRLLLEKKKANALFFIPSRNWRSQLLYTTSSYSTVPSSRAICDPSASSSMLSLYTPSPSVSTRDTRP